MNSTVGALGKASVQRTRFGTARQDTAVLQMGGAGVAQHAVSSTKHSTAQSGYSVELVSQFAARSPPATWQGRTGCPGPRQAGPLAMFHSHLSTLLQAIGGAQQLKLQKYLYCSAAFA